MNRKPGFYWVNVDFGSGMKKVGPVVAEWVAEREWFLAGSETPVAASLGEVGVLSDRLEEPS